MHSMTNLKRALAALFVATTGVAASCGDDKKNVDVAVACRTPVEFEVPLGVFNAPVLGLGDVLLLNDETMAAERVTQVALGEVVEKPIGKRTERFEAQLDFEFSGDVEGTAKGHLESVIRSGTQLDVDGAERRDYDLAQLHAAMNADAFLKSEMERAIQEHEPGRVHFFIVDTEVGATQLDLKAEQGTDVGGGASVIGYGDYEFKVSYRCDAELNQHADEGAAVFFKPGFLKLEGSGAAASVEFDRDFSGSVIGYDYSRARGGAS